jgi:hypothetical protein
MTTPTLSILERIALDVVRSLADVTAANGYQNTVADVLRPNPGVGNDVIDRRLIVIQGPEVREWDAPEQYTQWLQSFLILSMVIESEASSTSIDSRLNSLAADVESCLAKSRATLTDPITHATYGGQTRGGLAEDTILAGRGKDVDADPAAHDGAVLVLVQVRYRTKYNDPLTSIYSI